MTLLSEWKKWLGMQPSAADTTMNEDLIKHPLITDLSGDGILQVAGVDAERFLQGQATCDFHHINLQQSSLGAFCTPKGRMYANFRALQYNTDFYLQMHPTLVETTCQTLSKYAVFFKAQLSDARENWIRIGIQGNSNEWSNLTNENAVAPLENGFAIRVPGQPARYELWVNHFDSACHWWETLSTHHTITAPSSWELLDIQNGLARLSQPVIESFTPNMINYQQIGGISFTKGCYTGQEIVARTHYLGKLKRHLYRAQLKTDTPPAAGTAVMHRSEVVGEVVNAVKKNKSICELLMVAQHDAIQNPLKIHNIDVEVLPLPYAIQE